MKVETRFETVTNDKITFNSWLRETVKQAIGNEEPEAYIEKLINNLAKQIKAEVEPEEFVKIRVVESATPKHGWAYKPFRKSTDDVPGIVAGFCGDLQDFRETIAHELLHYLRWDEVATERKALELLRQEIKED